MQVLVWEAADGHIPPHLKFAARIIEGGSLLPVTFHAATQEAVEERAMKFWNDENDALHKKHGQMIADAKWRAKAKQPERAPVVVGDDDEEAV
jgi:hypothetical protein